MFDRVYETLEMKNADMVKDSRHITRDCDVIQGFGVYIRYHHSLSKLPQVLIFLLCHLTFVHSPNCS